MIEDLRMPLDEEISETTNNQHESQKKTSNEYVLNVAFLSFLFFTIFQFVFALLAQSTAMMTDCAAMTVDAITYLANWLAELLKHRALTDEEKKLPKEVLERRKRLQKLYLELFPPLLSVTTLVAVTIVALKGAIQIILEDDQTITNIPDVTIMLIFSALNLLLDFVNVLCFSRAEEAHITGLPTSLFDHHEHNNQSSSAEMASLVSNNGKEVYSSIDTIQSTLDADDDMESQASHELNLNMCSAWTHICADTLRSVAVLIAAGISSLFPDVLPPADADSYGAIVVSVIIIFSLGPLLQGLLSTAFEIRDIIREGRHMSGGILGR